MPKGSVAAKVEKKLEKEYSGGKKPRTKKQKAQVYGTMNKAGLMKGNKTTAKGRKPAKKSTSTSRRSKSK